MVSYIEIKQDEILFPENILRVYRGSPTNLIMVELLNGKLITYTVADAATATNALNTVRDQLQVITMQDTMNPPIFDTVNATPPVGKAPPDVTRGCDFIGVGPTHYSWNPATSSWVGIITP